MGVVNERTFRVATSRHRYILFLLPGAGQPSPSVLNHKFTSELGIVMPVETGIQELGKSLDSGSQAALRPLPGMTDP